MLRCNQYTAAAACLCLASDAKVFYADSSLQHAERARGAIQTFATVDSSRVHLRAPLFD